MSLLLGGLYTWILYNLPILIKGALCIHDVKEDEITPSTEMRGFPKFSIIVPAKNEALVLGRLLSRLTELDYPRGRYEVLVVEDGSSDETAQIGRDYEMKFPDLVRFCHQEMSAGKPAALNIGLALAGGEIIVVMDADNVPRRDFLRRAAGYFGDADVAAVQGLACAINGDESILTKICSQEETTWFRRCLLGKEKLGLFVPLTGSCGFIRREFLQKVGGWDGLSITEDIELAARAVEWRGRIRYAPDVVCFQEYPSSFPQLIRQRTRWARGYLETLLKYGKLMGRPNKMTVDVEFTLARPIVLNLVLLAYAITAVGILIPQAIGDSTLLALAEGASILTAGTLLVHGILIFHRIRPMRTRNLIWILIVYGYWIMQALIAAYAFLQFCLRKPAVWMKTEKTGRVTRSSV